MSFPYAWDKFTTQAYTHALKFLQYNFRKADSIPRSHTHTHTHEEKSIPVTPRFPLIVNIYTFSVDKHQKHFRGFSLILISCFS
jgi:hypothetical protein